MRFVKYKLVSGRALSDLAPLENPRTYVQRLTCLVISINKPIHRTTILGNASEHLVVYFIQAVNHGVEKLLGSFYPGAMPCLFRDELL